MNLDIDNKVIGYFAFSSPSEVICEGDACVISGSEKKKIKDYIASISGEVSKKNDNKENPVR